MRAMELASREENNVTVITVDGSVDALTSPRLEELLTQMITGDHRRLVLDLEKVVFLSSAGLRVIITTHKQLDGNGVIHLAAPQPNIRTVVEMVGLDRIIKVHDTVAEALEAAAG